MWIRSDCFRNRQMRVAELFLIFLRSVTTTCIGRRQNELLLKIAIVKVIKCKYQCDWKGGDGKRHLFRPLCFSRHKKRMQSLPCCEVTKIHKSEGKKAFILCLCCCTTLQAAGDGGRKLGAKFSLSALVFRQHRTCDRQGPCSTFSCEGSPKPFPPELWHLWPGFWAQATLVSKEWRPFVSSLLFFRRFSSRAAPGILASLSAPPSV